MKQSLKSVCALFFLPFLLSMILAGCLGRTKAPYVVDHYTLEYSPPRKTYASEVVNEFIRVERFSVTPAFNTTAMVVKTHPYRYETYNYSRWRINPSDMVSSFILRDITRAGIFKATYSAYDTDLARYIIDGHVDEFCEFAESTPAQVTLGVRITFIDMEEKNPVDQIIFQKHYVYSVPVTERSPGGMAMAMSAAMEDLSNDLIGDIRLALEERTGQ